MNVVRLSLTLAISLMASSACLAQAAAAPAGSTGLCKDGTYTTIATKKGSCAGHKGVKEWYGAAADAGAKPAANSAAAPASSAAPAAPASPAPKTAPAAADTKTQAPGGGAGQVWVNAKSKVYHCPGSKYYGKTKEGEYMTEAAAKAAGNHPNHGKACS